MKHYPDQDVADNRRSVRRRVRQLEQRQRRALREQGQQLLERAGRVSGPENPADEVRIQAGQLAHLQSLG